MHRTLLAAVLSVGLTASAWAGWDEVLADALAALEEAAGADAVADAQVLIGKIYYRGLKDSAEAQKWFQKAAERGHATAQVWIAYHQGTAERVKWIRMAAEQGDVEAQVTLGEMYASDIYMPLDIVQAHMWLSLATTHEDVDESDFLIYGWGENGLVRLKYAKETTIVYLESLMYPEELAEAQRLAREWLEQHGQ